MPTCPTRVSRGGRGHVEEGRGTWRGAGACGGVPGFIEDSWGVWMEGRVHGGTLVCMEEGGSVFGRGDMIEGE